MEQEKVKLNHTKKYMEDDQKKNYKHDKQKKKREPVGR